jgi:putative transposase
LVSLTRICRLLGVTRQAFYQYFDQLEHSTFASTLVVEEVKRIRLEHPVMGGRKLFCVLQEFLREHQIKMGRDALFQLLSAHKLLVRNKRRSIRTTYSNHWYKKYTNLIKNWSPEKPGQLWVADITYVPRRDGFLYLSLITDAYSHKIVGYDIAETLEAVHTMSALKMALLQVSTTRPLIHHSDRGIQYCSGPYVKLLQRHEVQISMTEGGDPLDNAIAERINGIIKNEYLQYYSFNDVTTARTLLTKVVNAYNRQRPHLSIGKLTPDIVHQLALPINKKWGKKKVRTL